MTQHIFDRINWCETGHRFEMARLFHHIDSNRNVVDMSNIIVYHLSRYVDVRI